MSVKPDEFISGEIVDGKRRFTGIDYARKGFEDKTVIVVIERDEKTGQIRIIDMTSEEKVKQVYPRAILQRPMQVAAGSRLAIWEPDQEVWIGHSSESATNSGRAQSAWDNAWFNVERDRTP
jgi:hypothetical protein